MVQNLGHTVGVTIVGHMADSGHHVALLDLETQYVLTIVAMA
jgi:hypothetical protein